MKFKPYSKEDEVAKIYEELRPGSSRDDQWPGSQGSLEDIRAKRASGKEFDEISNGIIDTEEEKAIWPRLTAQIDADIASHKEKYGEGDYVEEGEEVGEEEEGEEEEEEESK